MGRFIEKIIFCSVKKVFSKDILYSLSIYLLQTFTCTKLNISEHKLRKVNKSEEEGTKVNEGEQVM